jgi:hypothetical protein
MPRRRSSLRVTLVLIGAAAVTDCDTAPDRPMRRDVYATLEDCKKDWGQNELCEQRSASSSSTGGGLGPRFYGPSYEDRGGALGPRPGSRAIDSVPVTRGGFGSSARFHSVGS